MIASICFLSVRVSFTAVLCFLDNLVHLSFCVHLTRNSSIEIVGLIRAHTASAKARADIMPDYLFQRFAVPFKHGKHKERHHHKHHHHGGKRGINAILEQKKKRNANQRAAAKANDLPDCEVKKDLGFDFGQILRYRNTGHIEPPFNRCELKINFDTLAVLNSEKQSSTV